MGFKEFFGGFCGGSHHAWGGAEVKVDDGSVTG